MQITDIRVRKINAEGRMKAVVSVTFDDAFVVHDIKVIEGQDKLFIAMPSRKTPEGDFKDIAHPINAETREILHSSILKKYQRKHKHKDEKGLFFAFFCKKESFFIVSTQQGCRTAQPQSLPESSVRLCAIRRTLPSSSAADRDE